MTVDFRYDGTRLSFEADVDTEKALLVMDVLHRMLNGNEPAAEQPAPSPQRRRRISATKFVLNFLRDRPESTWEAIRVALIQAGLSGSKSSLIYLVNRGQVTKSADDPPRYAIST